MAVSALPRGPDISGIISKIFLLFFLTIFFRHYFPDSCEALVFSRGDGDGGVHPPGESPRPRGPVAGQWSGGGGREGRQPDHRAQGGGGHRDSGRNSHKKPYAATRHMHATNVAAGKTWCGSKCKTPNL